MLTNLSLLMQDFHFIRPLWLLLFLSLPLFLWFIVRQHPPFGVWQRIIDPTLLTTMLQQNHSITSSRKGSLWALLGWSIAICAIAGPSYKEMPEPVQHNQQALIIVLDQSLSMAAEDLKPSRTGRAIQKVTDIVRARPDGLTALIAYAGDAHIVTPLTTDTRTITGLLPALSPFIMPSPGSRPDKALALAHSLLTNAGVANADILLITDGVLTKDVARMKKQLSSGMSLKILALGSPEGAPIPLPNGGFLRDQQQNIVVANMDITTLASVSRQLNAPWRTVTLDDQDWRSLLTHTATKAASEHERTFDLWQDEGYWLILLLLPCTLLLFRRGTLLGISWLLPSFLLLGSISFTSTVFASPWQTPDQQGQALFNTDPAAAAEKFQHPQWKASAYYQAGDYAQAIEHFRELPQTPENLYNFGNALAQQGALEEAIAVYEQALEQQPNFPQARKNLDIVKQHAQESSKEDPSSDHDDQSGDADDSESTPPTSDKSASEQTDNASESSESTDASEPSSAPQQEATQEEGAAEDYSPSTPAEETTETEADSENDADSAAPISDDTGLSREEQETMEKWLKQVPDNPGLLLQRKFLYQYRQRAHDDFEQGDAAW